MNEPLTNSRPGISFCGKTHNSHPQWYNQPLRLTKEQKQDPLPVLDDFFECFHLNEVRQILWKWLTEAISSEGVIATDAYARIDHIYFYEKIETIIEAAYVMKKKLHKRLQNLEKRKLKQGIQPEISQSVDIMESTGLQILRSTTESDVNKFNKPKMLIEFVSENPMYVITEVFKNESLPFLRDQLRDWLLVALSTDTSNYEEGEQRKNLLLFQDRLQVLVEALFIIYTENIEKEDVKKHVTENDEPRLLSQAETSDPMQVIAGFFAEFPMVYITRELTDWLEAGIAYSGDYPENMSELQVLYTHQNILCLIKAANLIQNKKL